jgi:hypothetical protein
VSEHVALCPSLPGAVVTWFVTGSGPPHPGGMKDRWSAEQEPPHDRSSVPGDPGVVTGIGEQLYSLRATASASWDGEPGSVACAPSRPISCTDTCTMRLR